MSKTGNQKKKERGLKKKVLSLSFLISIPVAIFFTIFNLLNIFLYHFEHQADKLAWATFAMGFVASISILEGIKLPRFRTFIHELKHAIMIVGTGNIIHDFHVDKHTGHVEFYIHSNKLHFKPLIMVAPYFLPLFSFPVFALCLFLDASYSFPLWLVLGITLAADLDMGFKEIHPHQTDISRMFGGIYLFGIFIVCMKLMWCSFCLLWISGGWEALELATSTAWNQVSGLSGFLEELLEGRKAS